MPEIILAKLSVSYPNKKQAPTTPIQGLDDVF
jgi:hypothetical protein